MTVECGTLNYTSFYLREYQEEGVDFLHDRKRAMLLDAPGLGKTAQAAHAAVPPVLIISPSYLVSQWRDWLTGEDEKSLERNEGAVIPNVAGRVVAAIGYRHERYEALYAECDWLIVNHEMLDGFDEFKDPNWQQKWRTIIIDESHHLKSHIGKRARVAVALCKYAEYVYLLTATPVKREIDDFFMQLRILQPDLFSSYWRFVRTFCRTEENRFGVVILGAKKSMLKEFKQILTIMTLGRTYEDAGRELPPAIEKFVPVILNEETRRLYNELVSYWRIEDEAGRISFVNYMAVMHSLRRHITGVLKTDAIKEILADDDRKAVIFSWYKSSAIAIQQALGDDCIAITGSLDREVRAEDAKSAKYVSATISSLSEGIDLSDARIVIFAEEDWTPGSNYQALSRVRRERQNGDNAEPVLVYYVHCKNTIDESIHMISTTRAGTVREVIKNALYL